MKGLCGYYSPLEQTISAEFLSNLVAERDALTDVLPGGRGHLFVARGPDESGVWWNDEVHVVFSGILENRTEIESSFSDALRHLGGAGFEDDGYSRSGAAINSKQPQNSQRTAARLLAAALLAEGPTAWARFAGCFIAVVSRRVSGDRASEVIYLVHDTGGERTFIHSQGAGRIFFASSFSELSRLRALAGLQSEIDLQNVVDFLSVGCVPEGGTLFKHCQLLKPRSYIRISSSGELSEVEFPSLMQLHGLGAVISDLREADRLLLRSVSLRRGGGHQERIGIFPGEDLTAFGGLLDERAILALAVEPGAEVESDNLANGGGSFKITLLQRRPIIAASDSETLLARLAKSSIVPVSDPGILPRAIILEVAGHHFSTALTDDGVEAVCGLHHSLDWLAQLRWFPRSMRVAVSRLGIGGPAGLRRFMSMSAAAAAIASLGGFVAREKERLLASGVPREALSLRSFQRAAERHHIALEWPTIEGLHRFEVSEVLPYRVLPAVTALSDMTGVTLRPIFLDPLFLEHLQGCPWPERQLWWMMRRSLPRRFQRRHAARRVYRQYWGLLARGPMRGAISDFVRNSNEPLFSLLDQRECRRYIDGFLAGTDDRAAEVWNLIALGTWLREHVSNANISAALRSGSFSHDHSVAASITGQLSSANVAVESSAVRATHDVGSIDMGSGGVGGADL